MNTEDKKIDISEVQEVLLKFIEQTIKFPSSKICKHFVALELLSIMEDKFDFKVNPDLAKSICDAEDNITLEIIEKFKV